MYFETFADFLAMGKHGVYVWTSYGVFAAVFVYNIASSVLRKRKAMDDIKRQIRREQP